MWQALCQAKAGATRSKAGVALETEIRGMWPDGCSLGIDGHSLGECSGIGKAKRRFVEHVMCSL